MIEFLMFILLAISAACFYVAGHCRGSSRAERASKEAYRWYMANEKTLALLDECRAERLRDARGRFTRKETCSE